MASDLRQYRTDEVLNKVLNTSNDSLKVDIVAGAEYAEDSGHTSADTGNFVLGVRNDTLAALFDNVGLKGKFYRDTGTESGDVEVVVGDDLVGSDNILKHNTSSTLSSGDIMQILNNSSEVFSIDHQGALHLKGFTDAPTDNGAGTLYYDSVNKTLQLSVPE